MSFEELFERMNENLGIKPTDSPEFEKWFAGSKVADAEGHPLTVYKGMMINDWKTDKPFTEINSANGPWAGFFTSDLNTAKGFMSAFSGMGPSQVVSVKLSMKRPMVIDAEGHPAKEYMFDDTVFGKDPTNPGALAAFNQGYDGLIIRNTGDEADVYVPKDPDQIWRVE